MKTGKPTPEQWMLRLKRGYDAGYYKTEVALGEQDPFPWQNKRCKDCPFWLESRWCQVHGAPREPEAHTCSYFDEPYRLAARHIVEERQRLSRRRFWGWTSGNS